MDPLGIGLSLAAGIAAYIYVRHQQLMDGPDGVMIKQLKLAGSDLRKPHRVEFFFLTSSGAGASELSKALNGLGFQTETSESEDSEYRYCICAELETVPSLGRMRAFRSQLSKLASAHEAAYDGWGASVVAQNVG